MCLAKVYLDNNGARELLLEEVAVVEMADGKLVLRSIFNEQKTVEAKIRQIDFANSNVILEKVGS